MPEPLMNSDSLSFLEKWIEYDYNPFIVFDSTGKVTSLNREAQFLLGKVTSKQIFDIAVDYATGNFGFKTYFVDLELDKAEFFAITVGYESDENIGIKLYKRPHKKIKNFNTNLKELSNIYVLLDLAISSHATKTSAVFEKKYDPAIPEFYINVNEMLKLINKIYQSFLESTVITTKLSINVGEILRVGEKKYPFCRLSISGDRMDQSREKEIEMISHSAEASVFIQDGVISLDMALITDQIES